MDATELITFAETKAKLYKESVKTKTDYLAFLRQEFTKTQTDINQIQGAIAGIEQIIAEYKKQPAEPAKSESDGKIE